MFRWLRFVVGLTGAILKSRRNPLFENIALAHPKKHEPLASCSSNPAPDCRAALSKGFRQRPEEQSFGLSLKESLRKASDAKRDYARRKMAFVICRPFD